MLQTTLRFLRTAALLPLLLTYGLGHAQPKVPPKYKASPLYVAQLPKFCWQQYVDGSLGGQQFSIVDPSCGPEMNHFCPALVFLLQAQDQSQPKNERMGAMKHAVNDINYTLRGMKPGCHITAEVHAARDKAKVLAPMIGMR